MLFRKAPRSRPRLRPRTPPPGLLTTAPLAGPLRFAATLRTAGELSDGMDPSAAEGLPR